MAACKGLFFLPPCPALLPKKLPVGILPQSVIGPEIRQFMAIRWLCGRDRMSDLKSFSFVLTVAEGKRLIAKGVAALPAIEEAMQSGIVIVCKGSTNAYVAEELLGQPIAKGSYVLGRAVPAKADTSGSFSGNIGEVIFVNGEKADLTMKDALAQMKRGDVVIKGANALNYEAGVAGLLVGHPEGGTLGAFIGSYYGKGLHFVIPVGLEKEVVEDIQSLAELISSEPEISREGMPALWPMQGEIITELEALSLLTGVEAHQIGGGGLCGAEGGSWIAVWGSAEQIETVKQLVDQVQGEPGFGE
jgi:hypothetical protein